MVVLLRFVGGSRAWYAGRAALQDISEPQRGETLASSVNLGERGGSEVPGLRRSVPAPLNPPRLGCQDWAVPDGPSLSCIVQMASASCFGLSLLSRLWYGVVMDGGRRPRASPAKEGTWGWDGRAGALHQAELASSKRCPALRRSSLACRWSEVVVR